MKGKTSHFFLFFVFCFSSVLSARELTKEEVEAVEIGVGQQLKDPYSAKYTHGSYMFEGRSGGVYCGKVNAKNSYGAYIGDRLFAVAFIDTKSDGLQPYQLAVWIAKRLFHLFVHLLVMILE